MTGSRIVVEARFDGVVQYRYTAHPFPDMVGAAFFVDRAEFNRRFPNGGGR